MKFQKGQSGNPTGRPQGSKSKPTSTLRAKITQFLEDGFQQVQDDFINLPPKERVKLYTDLLQYGVPRLQAMTLETEFDTLTDDQLDQIIEKLKQAGTYD